MSSGKWDQRPSSTGSSSQDDGWEVYGKKSKNKAGNSGPKQWGPQNPTPKAWGHPDTVQKLGLRTGGGTGRGPGQTWPALPSDARRPGASTQSPVPQNHVDDDESDAGDDSDDDELLSEGFDSDESQTSHETRKKNKWFNELFECLDTLTVEQIGDPERQWHCPACKGGPGAIDWYRGLQPLMNHARTKGSKRVKLHRELAKLLEEELKIRGTSVVPAGEAFGKWKGLEEFADKDIVWPPMVMVLNTRLEKDDKDQWVGMGNQELLDYFSSYAAIRARHSYGPGGHRGISVLIFEASAVGYAEAERLSKHFEDNGRDRKAWERNRVPFYPGGHRQLYGYMAEKQDVENFNQHSHGKSKLKYDIQSYQEMVVEKMKQMSEDNQLLSWFKTKVEKEQRSKKALQENYGLVCEKLRKTMEENRIVKLMTKTHYQKNKEEMDYQEQFFKEQIDQFYEARIAKEENLEKMQQVERARLTQTEENQSSVVDHRSRMEEIEKFIQLQDEGMKALAAEYEKLMKTHKERKEALSRRYWEENIALEKEFDNDYSRLMETYTKKVSKQADGNTA